jgi:hypothetical protein
MTGYEIVKNAPPGTLGLLVRYRGRWYGVAATWSYSGSPVWVLAPTGEWVMTPWSAADFSGGRPSTPEAALKRVLQDAGVPYSQGQRFDT